MALLNRFRSKSMKDTNKRTGVVEKKGTRGSQNTGSYSLDDMLLEMSHGRLEEMFPVGGGFSRTHGMQCLIIPDKVLLTKYIQQQQSFTLSRGCGNCSSDQARVSVDTKPVMNGRASPNTFIKRSSGNPTTTSGEIQSRPISRSKTLQSFGPESPQNQERKAGVQLRRCISLYERKRTPHSCCHTGHTTDASLKPSAWSYSQTTTPRDSRKSKDAGLKQRRVPSTLSLDSVGVTNGRSSSLSFTSNSSDFDFDSPQTPKGSGKAPFGGNETPKSARPSYIPRPVTPAGEIYHRPRSNTVSEPLQVRPSSTFDNLRHDFGNFKRSQSFRVKKVSSPNTGRLAPASVTPSFSSARKTSTSSSRKSLDNGPPMAVEAVEIERKSSIIPDEEEGYPDPRPPGKKRAEIYHPRDYNHIDQHISKGDKTALRNNFDELLEYVLQDLTTDLAKVRALYRWLVTQELPLSVRPAHRNMNTPRGFLFNIRQRQATYPELFATLCRKAGIRCVIIHGLAKGVNYSVGDRVTVKKGKNSWNAVYIEDGWHFIHPLWAAHTIHGYRTGRWSVVECDDFHLGELVPEAPKTSEVNDFYFLTDPDKFITRCFPDDDHWQLLHKPLSKTDFEDLPFLQPSFYDLKLSVHGTYSCIVRTDNGKAEIKINLPSDRGKRYKFGYKLHARQFVDYEGEYDFMLLSRYILNYIHEDTAVFEVRFPYVGIFKLELHCKDPKRPLTSDWICSYRIICTEAMPECEPLPIIPHIGWGPGEALEAMGIECQTHKQPVISLDGETVTCIRFALPKNKSVDIEADMFTNIQSAEELRCHVNTEIDDEHVVVKVSPPGEGEYALQLYVKEENGDRKNVCNFLMHRTEIVEDPELADIRAELVNAAENGEVDNLSHWVDKFIEHNMEDRGDLSMAKKKLALAKLYRDIREAIERKDLDLLEKALHSASDTTIRQSLGELAVQAEAVRSRLRRLKRLRHEVLAMDQKTISEMRSYPKPPPPVHGVMAATFLLLGSPESDLKKWSKIQGLISKKGKEALKRRVAEFDINSVRSPVLSRVQTILARYDLETVQIASAGAATFYQWASTMAGENDHVE